MKESKVNSNSQIDKDNQIKPNDDDFVHPPQKKMNITSDGGTKQNRKQSFRNIENNIHSIGILDKKPTQINEIKISFGDESGAYINQSNVNSNTQPNDDNKLQLTTIKQAVQNDDNFVHPNQNLVMGNNKSMISDPNKEIKLLTLNKDKRTVHPQEKIVRDNDILFSHKNNILENKNKNDNKLTHPTEILNVMHRNEKQDITPYVNEESTYSAISKHDLKKIDAGLPDLKSNFGFQSSIPKPPRRRSKESQERSLCSPDMSRSTTKAAAAKEHDRKSHFNNTPMSPLRPHRSKTKLQNSYRPKSMQESYSEVQYEVLSPPTNTFHAMPKHRNNSRDKTCENNNKDFSKAKESDSFLLDERFPENDRTKVCDTVPPRRSQEPIPTPRKSTLGRSRVGTLEPHYKVPRSNPIPVNLADHHFYEEPASRNDLNGNNFLEDKKVYVKSNDSSSKAPESTTKEELEEKLEAANKQIAELLKTNAAAKLYTYSRTYYLICIFNSFQKTELIFKGNFSDFMLGLT